MKLVISFIVLVVLLFTGIMILIKPSLFVPMSNVSYPVGDHVFPKEIIILGSTMLITGLVGLSILGFKIFNGSEDEKARTN